MDAKLANKSLFKTTTLSTLVAALCCSASAFAEQKKSNDENKEIEKIIVVGATTNAVISPETLEDYQANDLEDIFRSTPSITVGGSLGIAQKIYVRGLEDSMVNVMVDGAPQTSTLFHHIGRVSIEPELLRSVEVQAGAGEATSGSGAVGGSIRFKTKTADDLLDGDEQFGGIVKGNYFSNDGHKKSVTLYGRVTDSVNVLASYVDVNRNNMEDGDGNEIFGTASDQTLGFVKVNAELSDDQAITLSYENRDEHGDFPKQTNWSPLVDAKLVESWGERETLVFNHVWSLSDLVNLETTLYNTEASFKRELYTWNAVIKTTGFDIRNTSDLGEHTLTYGIEHKNDEVTAQSYADFAGLYKEDGTVKGIYAQDHWQLTNELLVSFGLRYDSYELDHNATSLQYVKRGVVATDANGSPITKTKMFSIKKQSGTSKNIGLKYNLTDSLTLSAGYAEALRGRQIADAFTMDQIELIDEEQKPQEVENTELGLVYNDGEWLFEASVYDSVINDVVFDKFGSRIDKREGVFYENIGDLQSQGFELVAGYQAEHFDVLVSYNKNDVELNNSTFLKPDATSPLGFKEVVLDGVDLEAYEYGGLGNAVGDSINLNANYHFNDDIKMGVNYTHVFDLNDIEVFHRSMEIGYAQKLAYIDKPGYQVLDAYVSYEPTEQLRVALSVQNLLDKTYRSQGSVADYSQTGLPGYQGVKGFNEPGRDIRLSVSYQF